MEDSIIEENIFILIIICVFVFCLTLTFLSFGMGVTKGKTEGMSEGAMEVYRGNTKLKYTIVDSVKVDSCVIFLNK